MTDIVERLTSVLEIDPNYGKTYRMSLTYDDIEEAANTISSLRAEVERLNKAITYEQHRAGRVGTHGPDCHTWGHRHYDCAMRELATQAARIKELEEGQDGAYAERNQLVALLASLYPAGIKNTAIEGWDEAWHGCVYIDFPWGQASWHYHDSQSVMYSHLLPYEGSWDGHSTEQKYASIARALLNAKEPRG